MLFSLSLPLLFLLVCLISSTAFPLIHADFVGTFHPMQGEGSDAIKANKLTEDNNNKKKKALKRRSRCLRTMEGKKKQPRHVRQAKVKLYTWDRFFFGFCSLKKK